MARQKGSIRAMDFSDFLDQGPQQQKRGLRLICSCCWERFALLGAKSLLRFSGLMGHREGVFNGYTRDPGGTELLWGNPPLLKQKGIAAGYQTIVTLFKKKGERESFQERVV
jgi:hypothetical protein